ncbi:MAG: FadR family transcriptional regulator [Deltaproteobacteria bacterium]|nr:MAG: FadR family transcriptional regulator [Deltaproteobacteria bacterium]
MNYKTIQRSSASELVIKEILESIKSGKLMPGDKLPPERELTKMFGVGRSTLREAISALVLVGYLEVIQGRGTFLRKDFKPANLSAMELGDIQTAASIIDLVEVREILECNAVKLAAHRAASDDILRIKTALARMKETIDDYKRFSEYDFDFHIALAQATGNEMILEMMKLIVNKVHEQYDRFTPKTLFQTDKAVLTAEQIVASLSNGEAEKAAGFMRDHLNLVTTELKRMVPEAKRIRVRLF